MSIFHFSTLKYASFAMLDLLLMLDLKKHEVNNFKNTLSSNFDSSTLLLH